MKVLILLLFPICLFAQTERFYAVTSQTGVTLSTVDNISNYNGQAPSIHVSDSIRGGTFFLYTGTDEVDNGMVFLDANNNKWKRQASGDMNVRWYGAAPNKTGIENWNAIIAAKNYLLSHRQSFEWLYFPAGDYQITYTLLFTSSIKLKGTGVYNLPSSTLTFPFNTTGIAIHEYNLDFVSEMKDLQIRNQTNVLPIDSSKHLIDIRCKIIMDNIHVPYASGVGINLEACAGGDSTNNPIFGSVDFSIIRNCKVTFALHGFRTNGCDANHITFYNCEGMQNKRWGVYDNGFLGNTFYNCSFSANSNAAISGTATTVIYAGLYYAATTLHDDGSGIGKRPDQNSTYWRSAIPQAATVWDTTKHYWSGGSRISSHPSGTSQWYNNYEEGDQASPVQNSRSTTLFGVRGAGNPFGGTSIYSDQGTLTMTKTNVYGNLGVGQIADVASMIYPLQVESMLNSTVLARMKTNANSAAIHLVPSSGSVGFISAQGSNLYYGVTGVQLELNATSFKDYLGNGVINFGSAANQWKDVYAKRFFRDGVELTGAGGGITQQTLNDTAAAIRSAIPNVAGSVPILITLADNFSSNTTTMANVTGWDFPVTIGKIYRIEVIGDYQSSQATTTGCKFGIALTGGAAGTVRGSARGSISAAAVATELAIPIRTTAGAGSFLQTSGVSALNTPHFVWMVITFTCTTSGTFNLQFGSEVAASETRLNLGSSLIYQILN